MDRSKLVQRTPRRLRPGRAGLAAALTCALAVLAAAGALVAPSAGAASTDRRVFAFDRLNRAYELDDSQIRPVEQGAVTIHLSSPRNSLILKDHSVALTPLGDGTHDASIVLDFLGSGDLVADVVSGAGTSSRFDDLVIVPRQKVRLDGRVRFARVPDGWDVTALRLPKQVNLDIQSRLAGSLVTMCSQMALFLGLDCDGLDRSLSRVEVPLPAAGSVFFLPEEELTAAELRALETYLY